jgi:hypothetical protein
MTATMDRPDGDRQLQFPDFEKPATSVLADPPANHRHCVCFPAAAWTNIGHHRGGL